MVLVGVLLALVVVVACGRGVGVRRLGVATRPEPSRPDGSGEPAAGATSLVEDVGRRLVVCVGAGTAAGWALAGLVGAAVGALAGAASSWWLGRLEPPSVTRRREELTRDLPLAVDLLAACAEAGIPLDRALGVVGSAMSGPVGDQLSGVSARMTLGVDPVAEWRRVGHDEALAPLSRTMLRTIESGAPLAAGLARLADDRRREQRLHGQLRARKVGVQAAGPLGLCFLPAFMLVGVVPTVVGVFSAVVLQ